MIKGIKVLVLLSIISIVMLEKTNLRMLNEETTPTNPTTTEKVGSSLDNAKREVFTLSYEIKLLNDRVLDLKKNLNEAILKVNAELEKSSKSTNTSPSNGHRMLLLGEECAGDLCNLSVGQGCCDGCQCTRNGGIGICYFS